VGKLDSNSVLVVGKSAASLLASAPLARVKPATAWVALTRFAVYMLCSTSNPLAYQRTYAEWYYITCRSRKYSHPVVRLYPRHGAATKICRVA
jgi:hypothetical protein